METAWNVGIPVNLLEVKIDDSGNELYIEGVDYRTSVTAARDALSGYQKGNASIPSAILTLITSMLTISFQCLSSPCTENITSMVYGI